MSKDAFEVFTKKKNLKNILTGINFTTGPNFTISKNAFLQFFSLEMESYDCALKDLIFHSLARLARFVKGSLLRRSSFTNGSVWAHLCGWQISHSFLPNQSVF